MPILSGMGGAVEPVDDAQPLYEEAVRSFLSRAGEGAAGEGICRLLLQFENRWSRVAEMLVALLEEGVIGARWSVNIKIRLPQSQRYAKRCGN